VCIPGPRLEKYTKSFYTIQLADGSMYRPEIKNTLTLIIHREVINNHAWIIKCIIKEA